jgi:hypothetical protein
MHFNSQGVNDFSGRCTQIVPQILKGVPQHGDIVPRSWLGGTPRTTHSPIVNPLKVWLKDAKPPLEPIDKCTRSSKRTREISDVLPVDIASYLSNRKKFTSTLQKVVTSMDHRIGFTEQVKKHLSNLSSNNFAMYLLSEDEAMILRVVPVSLLHSVQVVSLSTINTNGNGARFTNDIIPNQLEMILEVDFVILSKLQEDINLNDNTSQEDQMIVAIFRGVHDGSPVLRDLDWLEDTIGYKKQSMKVLPTNTNTFNWGNMPLDISKFKWGEIYEQYQIPTYFGIPSVNKHLIPSQLEHLLSLDKDCIPLAHHKLLQLLGEIRPELMYILDKLTDTL